MLFKPPRQYYRDFVCLVYSASQITTSCMPCVASSPVCYPQYWKHHPNTTTMPNRPPKRETLLYEICLTPFSKVPTATAPNPVHEIKWNVSAVFYSMYIFFICLNAKHTVQKRNEYTLQRHAKLYTSKFTVNSKTKQEE